jgi:hypothetical protein
MVAEKSMVWRDLGRVSRISFSFVEDHDFDGVDLEGGGVAHEIDETTGGGDDDVWALLELFLLLARVETTDGLAECDVGESCELLCDAETLKSQFTSGHEDCDACGGDLFGAVEQALQNGNEEGTCFTGTSLRATDDVLAEECYWDSFGLDRCGSAEVHG